jgi:hypothetical protein
MNTNPGTENHGVYVSGGQVTIGAMATGPFATAQHQAAATADPHAAALRQLDLVLDLIRRHRTTLPDGAAAERAALEVRTELTAADPDRDRLVGAVGRITSRVAAVGALATAGAQLQSAIHALFG